MNEKDIPIIAYTAQTPDTLMAREGVEAVDIPARGMEALDVVHFMVKPCDHEELIAVVKRLLNNSKQVAGEPKTS